jgi:NitT/TauT family transport system permease protein
MAPKDASRAKTRANAPEGKIMPLPQADKPLSEISATSMFLLQALLGIALLAVWEFSADRLVDKFMISSPADAFMRLWGWIAAGTIWLHIWSTVYATVAGFLVGGLTGVAGGLLLGVSPFMSRLLDPYIWAFNALPKAALAPLFVLWFGLGINSKIALAATLVVFLVFVNTFAGVREVDRDLVDSLRLMRASRLQILVKVVVPSAASWIFVGLKTAVPYALIGTIIGEMIAANRGLGYLVQRSGSEFDTAGVFAALAVIAVLAVIFNELVGRLQKRTERWKLISR